MHRVVPDLIIENYRAGCFNGVLRAVGMFLDLSGFSAMTDSLMQHGQRGAEVLTSLMRGVFDPLVRSILDYGGHIVSFAGDGILALYPIDANERETALRALASALVIQRRLKDHPVRETIYGNFSFSVRIGLACGMVKWGILRSKEGTQASYYFRGSVVEDASRAEHLANAGDIVLTNDLSGWLRDAIQTSPLDASFQRLSRFLGEMPASAPKPLPPVDLEIARVFMPEDVIALDLRGEFRQIVNLFMRFPDLTEEKLNEFFGVVFELKNKYGGLVNRLDFGDKGCNMLMLWGAPIAYENDIGRALNFVLELKAKVDFPITAGVTYYIAHAGYLGSEMCEDYTCYGWGVNLASRFMMNAPNGAIWVDERIARRVSVRFDIEYIGAQRFKGFAAEQKVYVLHGRKHEMDTVYQGGIVGREEELKKLHEFLAPLWRGQFAGVHLIVGDAGIGKGRLVYEFRRSEIFNERTVLWALCHSDQILRQSFNPLRSWLMRYFGLAPQQSAEERRAAFDAKLDDLLALLPDSALKWELDRARSILAALVDVYWHDPLFEQLDGEGRYNHMFLALISLLKAESCRQPVILLLEDLHFADPDSIQFVVRLKRAVVAEGGAYPLAIIITSRPQGIIHTLDANLVDHRLDLTGLSEESISRLAEIRLGGNVAPALVRLLSERSEGNPFFAEQIILYLQEENLLEMSREGWTYVKHLRDVFLPGDIRAVLVSRLDQLARHVKEVVQTASVLGREFEIPLLAEILQMGEELKGHLVQAEQAAIWIPRGETRYLFTHGLMRDAAYSMQTHSRQRELHALAMKALERLHADDLDQHFDELAYHAEHAEDAPQAKKYYTLAGRVSKAIYRNIQAIECFTRALAFTPSHALEDQFSLLVERAELYGRIGDRSKQAHDLDTLERIARQLEDEYRLAQINMLHTRYCFDAGDYAGAVEYAGRVMSSSVLAEHAEIALETYTAWCLALLRQGKLADAMRIAQEGVQLARATHDRLREGYLLNAMGLIALEQKEPAAGRGYFEQTLIIAKETGDLNLELKCLNNLGNAAGYSEHDYPSARRYFEQSLAIAQKRGDRSLEGILLSNLGWASGMQGDLDAARSYYQRSLPIAREVGNLYFETYTLINLSAVAGYQGEAQIALEYARAARDLAVRSGERSGEAWSLLFEGYALLMLGNLEQAEHAFRNSLAIREELVQPNLMLEPIAGLVHLALKRGDHATALHYAESILSHFSKGGTMDGVEEPLRVYHACYEALKQNNDPRSTTILQQAIEFLETQIARIPDEKTRRMYVENIFWRRAIRDTWEAIRNS